jgi:hypothetical protein
MLKDATPDDLAIMSQQQSASGTTSSSDANSEFSRLQRLPGFSRLQRQLFFNMMTARPDMSEQNIRIDQNNPKFLKKHGVHVDADDHHTGRNASKFQSNQQSHSTLLSHTYTAEELMKNDFSDHNHLHYHPEESLNRETIKNISRLIVDRDGVKVKSTDKKK